MNWRNLAREEPANGSKVVLRAEYNWGSEPEMLCRYENDGTTNCFITADGPYILNPESAFWRYADE